MRLFSVSCKVSEIKTVLKLVRCFYLTTEMRRSECIPATQIYTKQLGKLQV